MRSAFSLSLWVVLALFATVGCRKDEPPADADPEEETAAPPATAPAADLSLPRPATDAVDAAHAETAGRLINRGVRFLLAQRNEQGGWALDGANEPAVTAMAVKVLLQHPDFDADSPVVRRGMERMLSYQQPDGGVYNPAEGLANYSTALAVMAMTTADSPQLNDDIRRAVAFLQAEQIVPGSESPDGTPIDDDHPFTGGVSYGHHGRPDLSNVGMWMQALHDAGVPGDDPAVQRALEFVERVQNRSESNTMGWARQGPDDGGFVYAPAVAGDLTTGESKAGAGPGGRGLRSYGSMTYVGFKSMLYADVARDDPRVRAAFDWIRRHWRLDSNPNMPRLRSKQWLYYYYHVFAKALRAWGRPTLRDDEGVEHNWRHELIGALAERVGDDGFWSNEADRWLEGHPTLCTCYAVLALQEAIRE
jgi:squalene-hopene/tetraprenyl-beta-curcumene cyclase